MYGTFALFVSENRYLQHIILPCILMKSEGKDFYTMQEVITAQSTVYKTGLLSAMQKQLVDTIALYEDKNLSKVYNGKKKPVKNFIETIDKKLFTETIRPFIDSCIVRCLKLALEHSIPMYIRNKGNSNFFDDDRLIVSDQTPELLFNFDKTAQGLHYHQTLLIKGKELHLFGKSHILLSKFPCRIIIDHHLFSFDDVDGAKLIPFFTKKQISVPAHLEQTYFETFIKNAITKYQVNARGFVVEECRFKPRFVLKVVQNLQYEQCFSLTIYYDKTLFEHNRKIPFVVDYKSDGDEHVYRKIIRDLSAENIFIASLLEKGLSIDVHGFFLVKPYQTVSDWIATNLTFFDRTDCVVMFDEKHQIIADTAEIKTDIVAVNDWFDVTVTVQIGSKTFPFVAFRKHILEGNREFVIDETQIFIIPEEWRSEEHTS